MIPVYQILCYFYSYTQSKKKECKFNLGGLKKQNRLWHCHANNKTGWHVDSFKLVGVHIILLMYILNVMHRPFLPSFWVFNEWWHETSKTWLAQKILNFLESFVLFFLFLHAKTIKRLSFQILCCKNTKKGLPNMEKVGANDIFGKKLSSQVATKI